MDWVTWKQKGAVYVERYKYLWLILLVGIFLMILPGGDSKEKTAEPPVQIRQEELQQSLSQILSCVEGAGKVEVLLTESAGSKTLYQTNENRSQSETTQDLRRDTVLVVNSSREETGLVQQIIPPTYQGAIVLCQGAENASVRLSIVRAVMSVTGLGSDRITVLKMK